MSETTSEHKAEAPKSLNYAVIVCSSSRYKRLKSLERVEDPSGDLIAQILQQHRHNITFRTIVPDDKLLIEENVKRALQSREVDVIITCGGTGISPTDVTIETVQSLLEKEIRGFGELFRKLSYENIGSAAILTRALGGVANGKAVFCLPGSPQAMSLSLEKIILPEAGHIVKHAREK